MPLALITFAVGPGLDPLAGGKGRDVLVGGTSIGSIAGGEGNDILLFNALNNPAAATAIASAACRGWRHGRKTRSTSPLDASASVAGDQAFAFIGTARFGAAGQVRYRQTGGRDRD